MDILTNKNKERARKSRLKTICTLETNELNLAQSSYGKQNRMRNSPLLTQKQKSQERSQAKQAKKKSSAHHFQSQYSAINQSQLRESTPKNIFKRAMSINQGKNLRLKTDYSEHDNPCMRRMMGSLKKKLVYPTEELQLTQSIHIIRKFYEREDQQYYQVKRGKKETKSVLIKTRSIVTKRQYENEMRVANGLSNIFKERQQDIFLKIDRVYKSQKEWVIVTENYFHPSWSEDRYYLLLIQFKNNGDLLLGIIRQVVQAVFITSHNGYVHGNIGLQSLYFPVYKGNLRLEGEIKIGGLSRAFQISRKEAFLGMPVAYRTAPQILNFMRFEGRQEFDRESLQYIGGLDEGWKIDVWAIGVLVLELLNGGVLAGEGCEMGEMVGLQRQILIRYSYLLCKVEERLRVVLVKMLSLNPRERPHPRELMKML